MRKIIITTTGESSAKNVGRLFIGKDARMSSMSLSAEEGEDIEGAFAMA